MRLLRFALVLVLATATAGCARAGKESASSVESASTDAQVSETVAGGVTTTSFASPPTSQAGGDGSERDDGAQPETLAGGSDEGGDVEREDAPADTVPTMGTVPPATGEVPPGYVDAVMADASNEAGVPVAELAVVRAEYVEWSDGSLGCPEPGVVYTQAITPGYRVEIAAGERTLDYRLAESGFFRLCGGTVAPHNGSSGVGGSTAPPSGDS